MGRQNYRKKRKHIKILNEIENGQNLLVSYRTFIRFLFHLNIAIKTTRLISQQNKQKTSFK